jgi:transcriptional regulator with XRE-family HTH domain
MTPKFRTEPCRCCGQDRQLVNGSWLREQRKAARIRLREVAAKAGVSIAIVSAVELGQQLCTLKIQKALEELLDSRISI